MLELLLSLLKKHGVEEYLISEVITESRELFYVKTALDLTRAKKVTDYSATIFVSDGKDKKGQSNLVFGPLSTESEIETKIVDCINSAKNAMNPAFELAKGEVADTLAQKEDLTALAEKTAKAIFEPKSESSFVNSAEVFAERVIVHTITSAGANVRYGQDKIKGEFVTQAKEPIDVELHVSFGYDFADEKSLSELVAQSLKTVSDRAIAKKELKSGVYDVVLDGKFIGTMMNLYVDRTSAGYCYMGYSDYKKGKVIVPEVKGEKLDIDLKATVEYSADGIKMVDRKLISDGVVETLHGQTRFCRYLGIEPTGVYDSIELHNGTRHFDELLTDGTLRVVAFSDFQCDSLTGVFGGEIRLAYLYQNGVAKPVTGGSISGNLLKLQDDLTFSVEKYSSHFYKGPNAVKIKGVTVAGE